MKQPRADGSYRVTLLRADKSHHVDVEGPDFHEVKVSTVDVDTNYAWAVGEFARYLLSVCPGGVFNRFALALDEEFRAHRELVDCAGMLANTCNWILAQSSRREVPKDEVPELGLDLPEQFRPPGFETLLKHSFTQDKDNDPSGQEDEVL